jgi:hypothetical protein
MDQTRVKYLIKKACSNDYRIAFKAIAELRNENDHFVLHAIEEVKAKDEQREFQLLIAKIVLQNGVSGLVEEWNRLPFSEWREHLMSEFCNFIELWAEEPFLNLFIHALDDPYDVVSGRAVIGLRHILEERTAKERRAMTKTAYGKARLAAIEKLQSYMSHERCKKASYAIFRKLQRHIDNPLQLTWFDSHVEVLGYTANKNDKEIIQMLLGFRKYAGEPYTVTHRVYNSENEPDLPASMLAEKKGVIVAGSILHTPTGLLDTHILEKALKSIGQRCP